MIIISAYMALHSLSQKVLKTEQEQMSLHR